VRLDKARWLRDGETERLFTDALAGRSLRSILALWMPHAAEIIRQLSLLGASIQGNRDALGWLRGEGSVFVIEERRERSIPMSAAKIDVRYVQGGIHQTSSPVWQNVGEQTNVDTGDGCRSMQQTVPISSTVCGPSHATAAVRSSCSRARSTTMPLCAASSCRAAGVAPARVNSA
jgi:hypothetical protein